MLSRDITINAAMATLQHELRVASPTEGYPETLDDGPEQHPGGAPPKSGEVQNETSEIKFPGPPETNERRDEEPEPAPTEEGPSSDLPERESRRASDRCWFVGNQPCRSRRRRDEDNEQLAVSVATLASRLSSHTDLCRCSRGSSATTSLTM
jgi:hypothetical protein